MMKYLTMRHSFNIKLIKEELPIKKLEYAYLFLFILGGLRISLYFFVEIFIKKS